MRTRPIPGSGRLSAYGGRRLDSYAGETPVLDLRTYLSGGLAAAGVLFGISGRVVRRFTIDMAGQWSGNRGTLEEHYRYEDGTTSERVWNLEFADDRHFAASAPDVEGRATGAQCGNAAVLRYALRVPRSGSDIVVGMSDWFYLVDDGTLINRARMSKYGLKVGELVATFRRHDRSR